MTLKKDFLTLQDLHEKLTKQISESEDLISTTEAKVKAKNLIKTVIRRHILHIRSRRCRHPVNDVAYIRRWCFDHSTPEIDHVLSNEHIIVSRNDIESLMIFYRDSEEQPIYRY